MNSHSLHTLESQIRREVRQTDTERGKGVYPVVWDGFSSTQGGVRCREGEGYPPPVSHVRWCD